MELLAKEVRAFLDDVYSGAVTLRHGLQPQIVYAGIVPYTASNGWTMLVYIDCGAFDYFESVRAPDMRTVGFKQLRDWVEDGELKKPDNDTAWEKFRVPGYLRVRCIDCGRELHREGDGFRCLKCGGGANLAEQLCPSGCGREAGNDGGDCSVCHDDKLERE